MEKNKSHIFRIAQKDAAIWKYIKQGTKRVETRAGTVKYTRVNVGDSIVFRCGTQECTKKVTKVSHFTSIKALSNKFPPILIHPQVTTLFELEELYASFPGYEEKIAENGIFAFELA